MGLPAAVFEQDLMYVPRRAFEVIEGDQTAEVFTDLYRFVSDSAGQRFWSVEVIDEFDSTGHLDILKGSIRRIPGISSIMEHTAKLPSGDIAFNAHDNLIRDVPDITSRRNAKGQHTSLGVTYEVAHNNPAIRFAAVNSLRTEGDPTIETVRAFEGWRYANDFQISAERLELARLAYKNFLFGVGSSTFMPALGYAATAYLK